MKEKGYEGGGRRKGKRGKICEGGTKSKKVSRAVTLETKMGPALLTKGERRLERIARLTPTVVEEKPLMNYVQGQKGLKRDKRKQGLRCTPYGRTRQVSHKRGWEDLPKTVEKIKIGKLESNLGKVERA